MRIESVFITGLVGDFDLDGVQINLLFVNFSKQSKHLFTRPFCYGQDMTQGQFLSEIQSFLVA